jgi:hypothetical protein
MSLFFNRIAIGRLKIIFLALQDSFGVGVQNDKEI